MTDNSVPMVSVCIITYNHENYISQAIDSVLSQKIDFPIEVLVGEVYDSTQGARPVRARAAAQR